MRWQGGRRSSNVRDVRGRGALIAGGGIGAVLLALIGALLGVDPGAIMPGGAPPTQELPSTDSAAFKGVDEEADFISVVLASTEDTWNQLFQTRGGDYREPELVLFRDAIQSGCGFAQAAVGPFYCPLDHKVYLDLSFFQELSERFGAPGDFARAYVIAHEVGHHVQTLLGVSDDVRQAQSRVPQEVANQLQVRMELQADCLAGVWGYHTQRSSTIKLDPDDLGEALNAAAAIGDDRMQRQTQGYVVPESFTHGSSEQRVQWFRIGFESGDPDRCDTFQGRL